MNASPKSKRTIIIGTVLAVLLVSGWILYRRTIRVTSIAEARENVLRDDLHTLRSIIHQYMLDKQRAPESLHELVSAGYLKEIPKDPITGKTDWRPEFQDVDNQDPAARLYIRTVHSRSNLMGSDGRPYSLW